MLRFTQGRLRPRDTLAIMALSLAACRREGASADFGPHGSRVSIEAQTMHFGFVGAAVDVPRTVGAFNISTHPVTVAEYRLCLAAGHCEPPASTAMPCTSAGRAPVLSSTFNGDPKLDALPVTCVTAKQAAGYCGWIDGALPTPDQWLLAARGPGVAHYPWGPAAPTCEAHPLSSACGRQAAEAFLVGKHPKGVSPLGLEDVLLAPAELVGGQMDAVLPACRAEACLVWSAAPAAIDTMVRLTPVEEENLTRVFEFRCVWGESS